ncbi:MAG TPA: hypothetical protein VGE38_08835 [Nocardioides sp.]|uniref:hypothetical protein n=1 Tax=Nocardioides sp. TaxID=35761 RepID=UPI002EDA3680
MSSATADPVVVVAYVLTGLAALVVVLTRLRLAASHPGTLLASHTWLGMLGVVIWTVFLVAPGDTTAGGSLVGVVALGCWWVVSLAGLVIMMRWMPSRSRGKRAARTASPAADSWTRGPGLSLLAHVGMFLGVCFFTWAYVTGAV